MPGRLLVGGRDEDDDGLICILVPQQCLKQARALRRILCVTVTPDDCERGLDYMPPVAWV